MDIKENTERFIKLSNKMAELRSVVHTLRDISEKLMEEYEYTAANIVESYIDLAEKDLELFQTQFDLLRALEEAKKHERN